jgi:hypothetical protein
MELTDFADWCTLHGIVACTTCREREALARAWNHAAASTLPWGVSPVMNVLLMSVAERDAYGEALAAEDTGRNGDSWPGYYDDPNIDESTYYHDGMSDDR